MKKTGNDKPAVHIQEGWIKRGGLNPDPKSEKPKVAPKGQGPAAGNGSTTKGPAQGGQD